MILTAHQPAYIPWLGYFHKIAISDIYVILDNVQFEKNSYTNRNQIKTSQGATWLTIPIEMSGHTDKTIREMKIHQINWATKHLKTIFQNYKKTPFFDNYYYFFENIYSKEYENLIDILIETTIFFIKELKINTRFVRQSELSVVSKKQELIIDLCHKLEADTFVFGKLGADYADVDYFKSKNIRVYFQDYQCNRYKQLYGDFISHLSIIDLLFNEGPDNALNIIMENNTSVIR